MPQKLHIGGIFLEPYFTVNGTQEAGSKNISIKMDEFYFNTYEALSYYKTNSKMNFESIYLLGQQKPDVVSNEYADSGSRQNNKPHVIELYAALAIDRFFSSPEKGIFGSVRKGKLDWTSFPKAEKDSQELWRLADFTRLQTVVMSEIYHYTDSVKGSIYERCGIMVPQWYKVYKMKNLDNKQQLQVIERYNILFLDWLYMVNCTYNAEGGLTLNTGMELYGSILEQVHQLSQEMEGQKKTEKNDIKQKIRQIRDSFDKLVTTVGNVEFVMEKVWMILSLLGIVPWNQVAGLGVVGLISRLASLTGRIEKEL